MALSIRSYECVREAAGVASIMRTRVVLGCCDNMSHAYVDLELHGMAYVYLELRRTLRYGDNAGEKDYKYNNYASGMSWGVFPGISRVIPQVLSHFRKFEPVVRLGWLAPARQ